MTIAILAALAFALQPAAAAATPVETVAVTGTAAADGTQVLVHEVVVAASPADVWEAVSTAQGWMTWAVPIAWQQGDLLETSYASAARPGDPTTIQQQILDRSPTAASSSAP